MTGQTSNSAEHTKHLEKARHNQKFFDFVEGNANEDFFDWKVTISFYVALHLIRAYLCKENKNPGASHHDLLQCIHHSPSEQLLTSCPFPRKQYNLYEEMYLKSKVSRYDGFLHKREHDEWEKIRLQDCKDNLEGEVV